MHSHCISLVIYLVKRFSNGNSTEQFRYVLEKDITSFPITQFIKRGSPQSLGQESITNSACTVRSSLRDANKWLTDWCNLCTSIRTLSISLQLQDCLAIHRLESVQCSVSPKDMNKQGIHTINLNCIALNYHQSERA